MFLFMGSRFSPTDTGFLRQILIIESQIWLYLPNFLMHLILSTEWDILQLKNDLAGPHYLTVDVPEKYLHSFTVITYQLTYTAIPIYCICDELTSANISEDNRSGLAVTGFIILFHFSLTGLKWPLISQTLQVKAQMEADWIRWGCSVQNGFEPVFFKFNWNDTGNTWNADHDWAVYNINAKYIVLSLYLNWMYCISFLTPFHHD